MLELLSRCANPVKDPATSKLLAPRLQLTTACNSVLLLMSWGASRWIFKSLGLTGMFTLASSLLNIFTLPSGAMLDALGPRSTAIIFGGLASLGCWIFSFGPENDTNYTIGFILMSLGGPYVFNCTMSFGDLAASQELLFK